jgi:hypothetical protein
MAVVQTLGLLHTMAHPGPHAHAAMVDAAPAVWATNEPGPLQALFAGHDDERACSLFDDISQADVVSQPGEPSLQGRATPDLLRQGGPGSWIAAQADAFDARAPPRA